MRYKKGVNVLSQARWAFLQLTQAEATWDFGLLGGGGVEKFICGTNGDLPGGDGTEGEKCSLIIDGNGAGKLSGSIGDEVPALKDVDCDW